MEAAMGYARGRERGSCDEQCLESDAAEPWRAVKACDEIRPRCCFVSLPLPITMVGRDVQKWQFNMHQDIR